MKKSIIITAMSVIAGLSIIGCKDRKLEKEDLLMDNTEFALVKEPNYMFEKNGVNITFNRKEKCFENSDEVVDTEEIEQTSQEIQETSIAEEVIDTEPPIIEGVKNRSYDIGDRISYMSGIYAYDNIDGEIDVEVDKSDVNVDEEGTYTVVYTAVDSSGNKTEEVAKFTLNKPLVKEELTYQEYARLIIDKVTDSSMSTGQKLKAIYNYTHANIAYTRCYDGSDWKNEARLALKSLYESNYSQGDCFTYTSTSKALLEELGVDVIWMENQNSPSGDHAWLLCNAGTGWYHFDTTRMYSGFTCFMKTDQDLEDYKNQGYYNYVRDESAYPATPTTPYTY